MSYGYEGPVIRCDGCKKLTGWRLIRRIFPAGFKPTEFYCPDCIDAAIEAHGGKVK